MEPLVYILAALWLLALLFCCTSWFSSCFCGLCCPIKLQRVLAVMALLVFFISLFSTLLATHRLKAAFAATTALAHDTIETVRIAHRLADEFRHRND